MVEYRGMKCKRFSSIYGGRALSRAHPRFGDAAVLMGYMGKNEPFDEAISEFSVAYADQNGRDHAALLEAIRSNRIEAKLGI